MTERRTGGALRVVALLRQAVRRARNRRAGMKIPVEVRVDVHSRRFDPLDERWLRQANDFFVELSHKVESVARVHEPTRGRKGAEHSVILTLGSAGVLTAAVEVFRSWIARDRSRSISISWHADGRLESVTLTGRDMNAASVAEILDALPRGDDAN
jgi:hypothetical protein